MRIAGTLTGLTPKDKADGTVIEIKITIPFASEDLAHLGALFGLSVHAEIVEQQQELQFEQS